jgi:hypothetical protein
VKKDRNEEQRKKVDDIFRLKNVEYECFEKMGRYQWEKNRARKKEAFFLSGDRSEE